MSNSKRQGSRESDSAAIDIPYALAKCLLPRMPALVFTGILLFIAVLHITGAFSADHLGQALPFFCPFKLLTGIPCPGCGMTHAVLALTKGDLHGAFAHNPFSFFLVFMVIVSIIPRKHFDKLPAFSAKIMEYFLVAVLFSLLLFWIIFRLVPHFP